MFELDIHLNIYIYIFFFIIAISGLTILADIEFFQGFYFLVLE